MIFLTNLLLLLATIDDDCFHSRVAQARSGAAVVIAAIVELSSRQHEKGHISSRPWRAGAPRKVATYVLLLMLLDSRVSTICSWTHKRHLLQLERESHIALLVECVFNINFRNDSGVRTCLTWSRLTWPSLFLSALPIIFLIVFSSKSIRNRILKSLEKNHFGSQSRKCRHVMRYHLRVNFSISISPSTTACTLEEHYEKIVRSRAGQDTFLIP